jgi:hypothetical protein
MPALSDFELCPVSFTERWMLRLRPITAVVCLLSLLAIPAVSAQNDELTKWLASKGFRRRSNPGSFSYLGYIFDDPYLTSQQAHADECFAVTTDAMRSIQGARQDHETSSYDATFRRTSLSAFLKLSRPSALSEKDLASIELRLKTEGAYSAALSVKQVSSKALSSLAISSGLNHQCGELLSSQHDWIVGEAIGVREMQFSFYSQAGTKVNLSAALLKQLFTLGFAKEGNGTLSATYDRPVWIGYKAVKRCKNGSYRSKC